MAEWLKTIGLRAMPIWVVFAAALFFGADTPVASFVFSGTLLILAAAAIVWRRTAIGLPELIVLILFLSFLVLARFRGWLAVGGYEYAALAACGGVLIASREAAYTARRADSLILLALIAGSAIALLAFADFMIDPGTQWGWPRPNRSDRLATPFLSANTAAAFYGSLVLLGIGHLLRQIRRPRFQARASWFETGIRSIALPSVCLIFTATALMLTVSRAGIALTVLCALILVGWETFDAVRRRRGGPVPVWIVRAWLVLAVSLALAFAASGGPLVDRFIDPGDDGRRQLFSAYAQGLAYRPWLGHGLGGFAAFNDYVASAGNANRLQAQAAAHNIVLQWLIQGGVLGALAMFGTVAAIAGRLWVGLRQRRRQLTLLRTILVVLFFMTAHGMVDYALEVPAIGWWLSWMLGLGLAIAVREEAG